jgi:hypothetical protein
MAAPKDENQSELLKFPTFKNNPLEQPQRPTAHQALDLFADDDTGPEMQLTGAEKPAANSARPEVASGIDLSSKKKITFWVGRGKTGKTTGIRWVAELAAHRGKSLLMADMDPTNDTFSKYVENVARPADASDPAIALRWLDKLLQHSMKQQSSVLIDLGGGDTTLRRLVSQLPDLVPLFEAHGFAVVVFHTVGPQEEDLSPLAILQGLGFRPTATAIVLNEALVHVGDTRETAFARVLRHSAFRRAITEGAIPVWMPKLLPAQQVEIRRLHYRDAADGLNGQASSPLSPFDRMRVRSWLDAMDHNFGGIKTWLP